MRRGGQHECSLKNFPLHPIIARRRYLICKIRFRIKFHRTLLAGHRLPQITETASCTRQFWGPELSRTSSPGWGHDWMDLYLTLGQIKRM